MSLFHNFWKASALLAWIPCTSGIIVIISQCTSPPRNRLQVPIMEGVPHLIENDSRIACHGVDVGMRMSIDPNIYPTVSDELCGIIQFSMSRNSHETIFLPIPLFTETGKIHNKLSRA